MDDGSQHVILVLDAIRSAQDQLRFFGYRLYLERKVKSWTQPRSISFCRVGHTPAEPALTFGFAIMRDNTGDRSIIFSILVSWSAFRWSVQAVVEDEDVCRELITDTLWESLEYQVTTLQELVGAIHSATQALISSVQDLKVATGLAAIEPRSES
jgi:hypothetical protein